MQRESQLVATLVELADNLVDDFDVVDILTVLSNRCVETLAVNSAGVMLATPDGELQFIAASSQSMRLLELLQLQTNEGPCVDCFRQGVPVINQSLVDATDRWPTFSPKARSHGVRSVHSIPMRLRGRTIGALNLFRTDDVIMDDVDLIVAQGLADVATIAILQHQTAADAQKLNDQLSNALNSRIIIEQAKGMISQIHQCDMDQAFSKLRTHARNNNQRLTDVARAIVDGTIAPDVVNQLSSQVRANPN